jgi:hypothetical protein
MPVNQYPTEVIELPSRGWYYPEGHPLSSGKLEIYYMTAKHEDILTSRNLIQRGVVIDKLMEALIADKSVKYDDLLLGDKNGLIIASRILGYGKDYTVAVTCPVCGASSKHEINLENINEKSVEFTNTAKGKNEFTWLAPFSKKTVTFRLLTHKDEKSINAELEGMRKAGVQITQEVTTRMRRSITAVDGDTDPQLIREFVDNMFAKDSMAFREYARTINPDIDLTFDFECAACGHNERMEVPIDVNFFWPNAGI